MSDDTPTGRFDRDGDEPTRRIPQQPDDAGTSEIPEQPDDAEARGIHEQPGTTANDAPTERYGVTPEETPTERYSVPPDDAVTRRYSSPADDAPTERYAAAPVLSAAPVARPSTPRDPERSSNAKTITLIVIGSILVAAIAILLLVLATRGNEPAPVASPSPSASTEPSASPTPSETPTSSPTPTPSASVSPPPAQGAEFTSFAPEDNSAVECPDDTSSVPLTFTWASTGAERAWIGVGTNDAQANPFAEVPTSGTFEDISFQCSNASEVYTVTLDDGAGTLTNATVTLVRELQ